MLWYLCMSIYIVVHATISDSYLNQCHRFYIFIRRICVQHPSVVRKLIQIQYECIYQKAVHIMLNHPVPSVCLKHCPIFFKKGSLLIQSFLFSTHFQRSTFVVCVVFRTLINLLLIKISSETISSLSINGSEYRHTFYSLICLAYCVVSYTYGVFNTSMLKINYLNQTFSI